MDELEEDILEMGQEDHSALQKLGTAAWALDAEIALLESDIAAKKKALRKLLERDLVESMGAAALAEFGFTTPSGSKARMCTETKVRGSLRYAPDQEEAVAFLESTGFKGGVKTNVSIDLTEEERSDLERMCDNINRATGKHTNVTRQVNPQTLMAYGREKLKYDPTWDYEKVGLTAITSVKFTTR